MLQIRCKATSHDPQNRKTMKSSITVVLTLFYLLFADPALFSQNFEIRMVQDDFEYIAVQMRETTGTALPNTSSDIMDIQFGIRWDQSYGTGLDVSLICSDYQLIDGLNNRQSEDGFYWRVFASDSVPFGPSESWIISQWVTIGRFKATASGQDTASFALAPDDFSLQGLNVNIDGTDFPITVGDSLASYVYPTTVYDFIWKGGATPSSGYDQSSWTYGLNWEDACGTLHEASSQPSGTSNCFIPGGLTYYPANFNNFSSGQCDILKMNNGAQLNIPTGKILNVTERADVNPAAQIHVANGGNLNIGLP